MKIIIAGCGSVGSSLAQKLSDGENEITIIDRDSEKLHRVTDNIDVMPVTGNMTSHQVLKEAGIEDADLFVAVTDSDETNLLGCVVARRTGHCQTIARIKNPIYNEEATFLKREFGIAMVVNPERAAALEIFRIFQYPSAIRVDSFAKGIVELLHIKLSENSPLSGMEISKLNTSLGTRVLICAVTRNEELIIPGGGFILQSGDTISVVAKRLDAVTFLRKINMAKNRVKDAVLIGSGEITYYLARLLIPTGCKVTIVEKNKSVCEDLSVTFPEATIICGDASDPELIAEEGLDKADAIASITNNDEENILMSLYAGKISTAKTVTRIDRVNFRSVVSEMNIGSTICPRVITSEYITRFIRAFNTDNDSEVESLYGLSDGRAEAMEFIIKKDSSFIGIPIMDLKFKPNTLIGCIARNRQVIIPSGHDTLQAGDSVLVIISGYTISSIREIFAQE